MKIASEARTASRLSATIAHEESSSEPTINCTRVKFEKIGGWLVLPAIGLVLDLLIFSALAYFGFNFVYDQATSGSSSSALEMSMHLNGLSTNAPLGLDAIDLPFLGLAIAFIVICAVILYSAILFFGKKRNAPKVMILRYAVPPCLLSVAYLLTLVSDPEGSMDMVYLIIGSVIVAIIWIPYFLMSSRVKRTFI